MILILFPTFISLFLLFYHLLKNDKMLLCHFFEQKTLSGKSGKNIYFQILTITIYLSNNVLIYFLNKKHAILILFSMTIFSFLFSILNCYSVRTYVETEIKTIIYQNSKQSHLMQCIALSKNKKI